MELLYQGVGGSVLALANPKDECFIIQLVGEVGRRNYHAALREVVKYSTKKPYTRILLNMKDLQSQPDLAGYWFWAHFMPRFYKNVGACKVAVLRSKQTIWQKQLNKILKIFKLTKLELEVRFFDALNTAQDWLIDGVLPDAPTLKETFQKQIEASKEKIGKLNPFRKKENGENEAETEEEGKKKGFRIRFHLPAFLQKKKNEEEDEEETPKKGFRLALPAFLQRKKAVETPAEEEELDDENEDSDAETPNPPKRYFWLKGLDWLKEKTSGWEFLKKFKIKVKFDPKGKLGENDDEKNA